VIYENFYKVYDKKKADRLGVAYTPNEIVRFMVEGADWLCQKHFGRALIDKDVEILDPCVGTGTFITEMIEHFRGQPGKLRYKYLEELHSNEVAILPYYVANLNIEATYATITQSYEEYPNLCFVDTLDNTAALRTHRGQQGDLFGAVSEENVARIKRQNKKKISVIIGNPPYNANQLNENQNNKNREYPEIDQRIRTTYVAGSRAQKTKQYDMFVRFVRWASDRIADNGVVAFITNRSFVDKYNFDGYRKSVAKEYYAIYVVDLGGDWKLRGAGGGGNVFGIATGVAIGFMVRRKSENPGSARIWYTTAPTLSGSEKLEWLAAQKASNIDFQMIEPDAQGTWIGQPQTEFEKGSLPLVVKTKTTRHKRALQRASIFSAYSLGISTNRDEWLYDFNQRALTTKVKAFIERYDSVQPNTDEFPDAIKWSETLKRRKESDEREKFDSRRTRLVLSRPYGFINLRHS
jgi:predicted helicase